MTDERFSGGVWRRKKTGELVLTLGINEPGWIKFTNLHGEEKTMPPQKKGGFDSFLENYTFIGMALQMIAAASE